MLILSDANTINKKAWSDFVLNHPKGNIFQTPEMFHVFEKTRNYFPIVVVAVDDNEVAGVLLGVIQQENKGSLGYLSARCIIFGGPLVKDDNFEVITTLLYEHNKKIKEKAIYSQFRNLFDMELNNSIFKKNGYQYQSHLDIHINLNQSFESLKTQIHKSRLKNYNKSINKGAEIRTLNSLHDIEKGYILLKETYNRIRLPLPDISHFQAIAEYLVPKQYCICFGLFFAEEMIGFRIVFTFNGIIYDYYAGSSLKHANKYPNDVLIIEILKWGCSHNYDYFDFGGAGKPGIKYNVRDYKLQFSNNLVEFGRFQRIHKPLLYSIAKLGLLVWKRFK
ncbi:MAG: GNAT family N-acetyltransferase [Bacteroidales bacterium]|nr:GNAT family N-acetyltransferase [Bacteroidales bacterium]